VSVKSLLVVAWACLIAGAAVASESQRLCLEQAAAEFERSHDIVQPDAPEIRLADDTVLIIARYDATN
tara:strand:- start:29433 stop:29636 length:204 start_codon:yes stop_codon:yes gene_type:complete